MKIFDELYVGRVVRSRKGDPPEDYVLGYATPVENGVAFQRRKSSVDAWAQVNPRFGTKEVLEPLTIQNNLQSGFKIVSKMTRYTWSWHGDNKDIWRVQDPRGFELEIGGENVYNIIESVGIEKGGIIPGRCLWGRDKGKNILLHEGLEIFSKAIDNPTNKKQYLKKGDLVVGKSYEIASYKNIPLVYMGQYFGYSLEKTEEPIDGVEGAKLVHCRIKTHEGCYVFGFSQKSLRWSETRPDTMVVVFSTLPKILGLHSRQISLLEDIHDVYTEDFMDYRNKHLLIQQKNEPVELWWKYFRGHYTDEEFQGSGVLSCYRPTELQEEGRFGGPFAYEAVERIWGANRLPYLTYNYMVHSLIHSSEDLVTYIDSPEAVKGVSTTPPYESGKKLPGSWTVEKLSIVRKSHK